MTPEQEATCVDAAILNVVLPQAYQIIDELLQAGGAPSKDLTIRAKRLLPGQYAMSFEHRKVGGG